MIFGKSKLLINGVAAKGVVIESLLPADTDSGGIGRSYGVKVRVQFPDGSTGEFTQKHLDRYKHGWLRTGDIAPVRYDQADHSKIAVDTDALVSERAAEAAQADSWEQARIAQAESDLAGEPGPETTPGHS